MPRSWQAQGEEVRYPPRLSFYASAAESPSAVEAEFLGHGWRDNPHSPAEIPQTTARARAEHQRPLQLLGIVPAKAGGFGDVTRSSNAFFELEIEPLQSVFQELNEMMSVGVVRFRDRSTLTD